MKKPLIVTIDGPAGAGKSTVAQKLAQLLGLAYLDSGATYRAAALKVLEAGIPPEDEPSVTALILATDIGLATDSGRSRVLLEGQDISTRIRTPEVTAAASVISQFPAVRHKLARLQRSLATGAGIVMEGRDIGTVVFPEAPLKIFLVADPEERARRRMGQEKESGSLEETKRQIIRRDRQDIERRVSPLVPADDAVEIDSTHLNADQVVESIMQLARLRGLLQDRRAVNGAQETPET